MDLGRVLLDLLVVLVVARVAAEASERLKQPAVLGEILLGILIGPSALGLVGRSEDLRILGEIGVILLLFEVGRQMDLREMRRVGGASLRVAILGIVAPMAVGLPAMRLLGVSGSPALFLAAGITATSVGITARVFGDMRALSTVEARTVLGAAIADDVIGLLILTIVTRTTGGESISPASLGGIVGLALGFVVVATAVGAWFGPKLLDWMSKRARTDGTVMAIGLIMAVGFARLAATARLAPIVGAFVAGLAVGRSEVADDLHRRLTPLGHFFIPIFFLQIGIDTKLTVFGSAKVLGLAAVLTTIAVATKIVAGLGARRADGDRLLVGIAMIPRGEVGLIFASLGLTRGILGAQEYAVMLLVVLVTTLVTPPWMRRRIERTRRSAITGRVPAIEPPEGWLRIDDESVELTAEPPSTLAARIGLDAAVACAERKPGPNLTGWLASAPETTTWDEAVRRSFFHFLRAGNERSWRFVEVTGLLARLLPELTTPLLRRPRDAFDLEPEGTATLPLLQEVRRATREDGLPATVWAELKAKDVVLLAAIARDAFSSEKDPAAAARRLALATGLSQAEAFDVGFLVGERHLVPAAAARIDLNEDGVLELATFIETKDRADGLWLLAVAEDGMESWQRERLDELYGFICVALGQAELTGPSARELVEQRTQAAVASLPDLDDKVVRSHLLAAPRKYVLSQSPQAIARHVTMVTPKPGRFESRISARQDGPDEWTLDVAVIDRRGVLATIAGALTSAAVSVSDAQISTWRNGVAVDVFRVRAPIGVDWDAVRRRIDAALSQQESGLPEAVVDGTVEIDNLASPWHTILEVHAKDRAGLLHRVASALSRAGLQIHQATVTTRNGAAVDTFWVTGRNGGKLDASGERDLRAAFAGKGARRWRRPGRLGSGP